MADNDKLPVYEESPAGDDTVQYKHRAGQLITWRKKWRLSQAQLGKILDIGTRTINRYEAGEREVPFVVIVACRWYDEHPKEISTALGVISLE